MQDNKEPSQGELLPLIEQAEQLTQGLRELHERIGATALEELDGITRHSLQEMSTRLGGVARSVGLLAHARPSAAEPRPRTPEESLLYESILGPEFRRRFSDIQFKEPPTILRIQDDTTFVVEKQTIRLSREGIFLFNKLLLEDSGCDTAYFVQKFRRDGESLTSAKNRTRNIVKELQRALGEGVIYQLHRYRHRDLYLSKNIILIDGRSAKISALADEALLPSSDTQKSAQLDKEDAKPEQAPVITQEKPWEDADYIATQADVPVEVARAFIALHRPKLGTVFSASQMRDRPGPSEYIILNTEHFSPKFVEWAIAGLRKAKAAYEARHPDVNKRKSH